MTGAPLSGSAPLLCRIGLHRWKPIGLSALTPFTFYEVCSRCGRGRGQSLFGGSWEVNLARELDRPTTIPMEEGVAALSKLRGES